ncbi:hypothetical protein ACVWYH_005015 [Bradyrhizobium sp. GM24.11]
MQGITDIFKLEQYVTTSDGSTAFIFGEDNGAYKIALCDRDEERTASASELTRWAPRGREKEPVWV